MRPAWSPRLPGESIADGPRPNVRTLTLVDTDLNQLRAIRFIHC